MFKASSVHKHIRIPIHNLQFSRRVWERAPVCICQPEQWLISVFEVAINNRAPGQKDEAKICSDRLAQVDGWQCEGINESTGLPTHGDASAADGLMWSLYGKVCVCVCNCGGGKRKRDGKWHRRVTGPVCSPIINGRIRGKCQCASTENFDFNLTDNVLFEHLISWSPGFFKSQSGRTISTHTILI